MGRPKFPKSEEEWLNMVAETIVLVLAAIYLIFIFKKN